MRHLMRTLITFLYAALAVPASPTHASLTIDQLVQFRHPSEPAWSPDGSRVAFLWDQSGIQNLFVVAVADTRPGSPKPLTSFEDADIGAPMWSADGVTLYFERAGDIWRLPADGSAPPRPVWTSAEAESGFALSPDGTRLAFVRGDDLWTRSLADDSETRLTATPETESRPVWSPSSGRLAFTTSTSIRHADPVGYSGPKILYAWFERRVGDLYVVPSAGGPAIPIEPSASFREGGPRWLDANRLAFERVSEDTTTREIVVADATAGQGLVLHRDVDSWWSPPFSARPGPVPSPDGRRIAFLSDRDGWDHLYVVSASGGPAVQITRGRFEAWRPAWSPDGTRLAYDANPGENPGVRHIGVATLGSDPGAPAIRYLTSGRGTNTWASWSPDGERILYQHTDPSSSADLYAVRDQGAPPIRLTDSMPAELRRESLVEPELVWYEAGDGRRVPAYLFVPKDLDRSRRHPAIVWIHGDGTNQNYDGWHIERNYAVYYSFHQHLLERGYVVLAPDYRGSIGYGREWRQGAFMEVGGKDYQDAADSATYLKTIPFIDGERIGVWGLSYGGFFTLQALTLAPDLFRCGVDVAGPVDYRMYYQDPYRSTWTYSRLRAPADSPAQYDVASPIDRAARISRPLLILHGTADVNVPYLHSVRLVDELMKLGKRFQFMMYPGELHYFRRAHVLRDAWERVERFFDAHLRDRSRGTE